MKTVPVRTPSSQYEVRIGAGLLTALGSAVKESTDALRCMLVSGEHVFPLYGETAVQSLRDAGLSVETAVFPSGEKTKSLECYGELLNRLSDARFSRSDCLVALGGGVTGDLTGFAAATYQRGIPYVQVPTTLLAGVDSSVGGKTAINLPTAKNQVGAFYQPALVLCDTDTLSTLPEREMRSGMAEVIKYAVLGDQDLFDGLLRDDYRMDSVIETCVRMKAEIVEEDEHDHGRRRLLNLGHSFGHAVENRCGYRLTHGECVAIGMAMISRAAVKMGRMDSGSETAVKDILIQFGLPTEPDYGPEELYESLLLDKKFAGGKLHLVVPIVVGWCETVAVTPGELRLWLEAAYD